MKIDPSQYVDLAHGAELAGCTREYMRRLAQAKDDNVVGGIAVDGHWFVRKDLAAGLQIHPTKGRPGTRRRK